MSIVDHLEQGITVECADGAKITCPPLRLRDARFFIEQWERLISEDAGERIDARIQIAKRFAEAYPELAEHIGGGDAENLLPLFFWGTTGAKVVPANGKSQPTGTPSPSPTAPSGA